MSTYLHELVFSSTDAFSHVLVVANARQMLRGVKVHDYAVLHMHIYKHASNIDIM